MALFLLIQTGLKFITHYKNVQETECTGIFKYIIWFDKKIIEINKGISFN